MSNWTATNELRFVERKERVWPDYVECSDSWNKTILQQKWVGEGVSAYTGEWEAMEEWRDVPVVEEE
jgi:hypothetical protein